MNVRQRWPMALASLAALSLPVIALSATDPVSDAVIAEQRQTLQENTYGKGFGPQSPRNIDQSAGNNAVVFTMAPPHNEMTLCNIHFHSGAEHAGGQFTDYAGNGDGQGYQSGYLYTGTLSAQERAPVSESICPGEHGQLQAGDTIEIHYVHTTAEVAPGPTLGACLSDAAANPQLRVEAQVYVLVNDPHALDFRQLTAIEQVGARYQSVNMPNWLGDPVEYAGSTTGPGYNEKGSPFQVSWRVYPKVARVNIGSVGQWCQGNRFDEDHAHGVRNLVTNPALLAPIP
ncbi:hypothetical protein KUV89_17900 [Marinobacter hydrocarbonoclasticus]|nr:hypothetical protein [Marinobacter nauticus]